MSRPTARTLLAGLAFLGLTTASLADEWIAVRLRGEVFVYRDGWVKLERGDVVADDSIIRTLGRGRVSFERGAETIDLLPNSQIRIVDQTGGEFTTVMNDYGDVAIEAEVQNIEHFSVATPFLAAVVKGTRFSVSTNGIGSEVSVQRGKVFVEDYEGHDSVTIVAGQTASTSSSSSGETLIVTGSPASTPAPPVVIAVPAPNAPPPVHVETTSPLIASVPEGPPAVVVDTPAASDDSGEEDDGPGNDNGNHHGNDNENAGPGNNNGDNGNHTGNDNENSGPGNNNGNDNPNSGPGNNNGNGNDNSGPGNNNGKGNG